MASIFQDEVGFYFLVMRDVTIDGKVGIMMNLAFQCFN